MAYNTTATLDKLCCTDYMDFGSRDLDNFLGPKTTPTTWIVNKKLFKREDKNAEFRLRQNFSMGGADFNQYIRQRKK